jgi:hypothetical protein
MIVLLWTQERTTEGKGVPSWRGECELLGPRMSLCKKQGKSVGLCQTNNALREPRESEYHRPGDLSGVDLQNTRTREVKVRSISKYSRYNIF